jgi:hypothetical protein
MKIRVPNYTFSPGGANIGTVTFASYPSITLDSVLLITNVTSNIIIYNFADPTAGGSVNGNVLTLEYNTTAMNSSDKLIIYYDDPVNIPATDSTIQSLINLTQIQTDTVGLLKRISEYTSNLDVTDQSQRLRINVDTGTLTSLASLTLATNVTSSVRVMDVNNSPVYTINVNNPQSVFYSIPDVWKFVDASRLNFGECIRPNITFT